MVKLICKNISYKTTANWFHKIIILKRFLNATYRELYILKNHFLHLRSIAVCCIWRHYCPNKETCVLDDWLVEIIFILLDLVLLLFPMRLHLLGSAGVRESPLPAPLVMTVSGKYLGCSHQRWASPQWHGKRAVDLPSVPVFVPSFPWCLCPLDSRELELLPNPLIISLPCLFRPPCPMLDDKSLWNSDPCCLAFLLCQTCESMESA